MRGEKTGAAWPAAGLDSGIVSKPGSSISPRRKCLRGMGACMGACLVVELAGFIVTTVQFPDKREFPSLGCLPYSMSDLVIIVRPAHFPTVMTWNRRRLPSFALAGTRLLLSRLPVDAQDGMPWLAATAVVPGCRWSIPSMMYRA